MTDENAKVYTLCKIICMINLEEDFCSPSQKQNKTKRITKDDL